ncbi:MAG: hypothetical protein JW920_09520 [Deltaproteobacteria bacterium]|nr:hypothetical protein [Deltaproteobacteria bacterium]
MNQVNTAIQKTSYTRRIVMPAAVVLVVMALSFIVYGSAWRIDSYALHRFVSHLSAVVLFISIGFGPLLVYPVAYFRGAGVGERIYASLIPPIIWLVKELIRVSEFFTFGETMYFIFNPLNIMIFIGAFGLMALSELFCRRSMKKRTGKPEKVITVLPVFAICTAIAGLYIFMIWGGGVHMFYIYMKVYKALFI